MPFEKGQPARPDGRRLEAAVRRQARAEAVRSIAALAAVRDNEAAAPELRAQAAMQILAMGSWKVKRGGMAAAAAG